jgi:GTP pyrophosphokinase
MTPAQRCAKVSQNMDNIALITFAIGFCKAAHFGQKRKWSFEPYWTHPMAVANILHEHGHNDPHMQIVALLHDVVEDTPITLEEITEHFGEKVAEDVHWLTKVDYSKHTDPFGMPLKRAAKKFLENLRLSRAPQHVKTIKLADRLHNMTILTEDPAFAPLYAEETRELLDYALKEGCPVLWAKLDKIIKNFQNPIDKAI